MSSQILINGIVIGALYVMLALGFSMIYTSTGFFNLSHGAILLTGAYVSYAAGALWGLGFAASVVIGALAATAIHVVAAAGIYLPMRSRGASMWIMAIGSLGFAIVSQAAIGIVFGTRTLNIREGYVAPVLQVGEVRVSYIDVAIIAISVVLVTATHQFLQRTKTGIGIRAAMADRDMAQAVGIRVRSLELLVFAIGAFLAGTAGGLYALKGAIIYSMGGPALLKSIVVSILGIPFGLVGVFGGGIFLGVVENVVVANW